MLFRNSTRHSASPLHQLLPLSIPSNFQTMTQSHVPSASSTAIQPSMATKLESFTWVLVNPQNLKSSQIPLDLPTTQPSFPRWERLHASKAQHSTCKASIVNSTPTANTPTAGVTAPPKSSSTSQP